MKIIKNEENEEKIKMERMVREGEEERRSRRRKKRRRIGRRT